MTTSITQAEATVLTETVKVNKEVIKGLRYTAVLDGRTTEICAHHDGTVYSADDKRFVPPLHWNCRSVLVPVIIPKSEMDASTNKRFNKAILAKLSPRQVGYFDGSPPAVENYDTWLRRQPFEVQLRHLDGDEDRLALWQSGNIQLKQFTTAKGDAVDVATLSRLDNRSVSAPIRQSPYEPAENLSLIHI